MVIRKVTTSGIISTVAGNNTAGYSGDGGAATAAQLNTPKDIAFDATGNMYISDNANHVIRMITTAGIISTIAGVGLPGFSGDGGPATIASLKYPDGLQIDAAGNMFISDGGNNRVRVIKVSGKIFTVAGTGTYSFSGDGGPATAATMKSPTATTKDASGNLYIADTDNRIRKVTPTPLTLSGAGSLCEGATISMTGSIPDGSWTSSNTAVATVGTSGTVTAVAAGTAIITYTESMVDATKTITVTPMPAAITGASSVCIAATTPLANTVAGGARTSSDGTIATVDASGIVTGVAVGIVGITYNISSCYVTSPIVVTTCTPTYLSVNSNGSDVSVYPNPAYRYFTIVLPSGTTSVSVIDLMGKEIMNIHPGTQTQNITLQTTDLTPGNYIIKITTGNSIYRNSISILK
jgi:trimeric autotransporter adhesin